MAFFASLQFRYVGQELSALEGAYKGFLQMARVS
jgi:hypothetical protein